MTDVSYDMSYDTRPQLRWMVRLEAVQGRFGDRREDTLAWFVHAYIGRHSDGSLIVVGGGRPFPTLQAAFAAAQARAHRAYGRPLRSVSYDMSYDTGVSGKGPRP